MKIETSIINKFNRKITVLTDIQREIKEDKDLEDAQYYLDNTLPELKTELRILCDYFITDEIHESNIAFDKNIERETPDWYQTYRELRDLLIRTETELELFLKYNKK